MKKKILQKPAFAYCIYLGCGELAKTKEDYVAFNKLAINAYKEANKTYKAVNNKSHQLECLAEVNFIRALLSDSIEVARDALVKSYQLLIESGEIYAEKNKKKSFARVLSRAAMASFLLITYYSESRDIEQVYKKGREVAVKAWEISKEVNNINSLAHAFFAERMLTFIIYCILPFKQDEDWKDYMKKGLTRCDEILTLAKNYEDPYILGIVYSTVGSWFFAYGFQFIEDEIRQKAYTEKGLKLMEKGLAFSKKSQNNALTINSLWWLNWLAISIRKFEFVQSRISDDLQEIEKLGTIFSNSYSIWYYYSNLLPAFYYATVSHRSFFPLDQRKIYAKKAIEYANKALINLAFKPYFGWPYQMKTWAYSQLLNLDSSKKKKEECINNMLQYALKAKELGEKYKGGFVRAICYSGSGCR